MATDETINATDQETLRKLAEDLDCFAEFQIWQLGNITPNTCEAWRKRGTGPAYIRFGRNFFYPKVATRDFFAGRLKAGRPQLEGVL